MEPCPKNPWLSFAWLILCRGNNCWGQFVAVVYTAYSSFVILIFTNLGDFNKGRAPMEDEGTHVAGSFFEKPQVPVHQRVQQLHHGIDCGHLGMDDLEVSPGKSAASNLQ